MFSEKRKVFSVRRRERFFSRKKRGFFKGRRSFFWGRRGFFVEEVTGIFSKERTVFLFQGEERFLFVRRGFSQVRRFFFLTNETIFSLLWTGEGFSFY